MIYVISGNEGYLVKSKIDEIINDHQDASIIKFDMMDKNVTIYDIIAECNTIDLFADKKIVLVENPLFLSAKTNLNDNEYLDEDLLNLDLYMGNNYLGKVEQVEYLTKNKKLLIVSKHYIPFELVKEIDFLNKKIIIEEVSGL